MNENKPLVSVIVPCYNHEKYITQCIESIVKQTYKNFELIVIDDGSKDNSRVILEDLQSKYDFNLVFQENHGVAYTLNRGIKEYATGKYVTFCASDDYWALDKLEKQVQFMENNRFYPLCFGKTHYVNEESELLPKLDAMNNVLKGGCLFEDILLFKIHPPVNYLFRKSIFNEIGYYDEKIFAEDYDMNLRISSKYAIGFLDDYLGFYRFTVTTNKIIGFETISNSHLISIENYKEHPLYNKAKRMVFLRKFDLYSGFTSFKKKAFLNMFTSIRFFFKKRFIVSVIKLVVFWK